MSQGFTQPLGVGRIIQVVNTQTGALTVCSTQIPFDDTIPQNTEGTEVMTLAITPTNTNNKLKIDVIVQIGNMAGTNPQALAALFQDSTAGALAAGVATLVSTGSSGGAGGPVTITHFMTAGTISSTTFKVRVGTASAGHTAYFNGGSARIFGGVCASSITITEIKV